MSQYIRHMSINLAGMLRNYKRKKINIFSDDNGRELSDAQARKYIADCQAKGWKVIPCSDDCEGFDHFGKGCPGHLKEEPQLISTSLNDQLHGQQ